MTENIWKEKQLRSDDNKQKHDKINEIKKNKDFELSERVVNVAGTWTTTKNGIKRVNETEKKKETIERKRFDETLQNIEHLKENDRRQRTSENYRENLKRRKYWKSKMTDHANPVDVLNVNGNVCEKCRRWNRNSLIEDDDADTIGRFLRNVEKLAWFCEFSLPKNRIVVGATRKKLMTRLSDMKFGQCIRKPFATTQNQSYATSERVMAIEASANETHTKRQHEQHRVPRGTKRSNNNNEKETSHTIFKKRYDNSSSSMNDRNTHADANTHEYDEPGEMSCYEQKWIESNRLEGFDVCDRWWTKKKKKQNTSENRWQQNSKRNRWKWYLFFSFKWIFELKIDQIELKWSEMKKKTVRTKQNRGKSDCRGYCVETKIKRIKMEIKWPTISFSFYFGSFVRLIWRMHRAPSRMHRTVCIGNEAKKENRFDRRNLMIMKWRFWYDDDNDMNMNMNMILTLEIRW